MSGIVTAPRLTPRPRRRRTGSTGGHRREDVPTELKSADVRAFGRAFDALVRSVRTHGHAIEGAAERAHGLWRSLGDAPMELDATRVTVSGRVALDEGEHDVRWLLPAFMAGLRRITPRPEVTPEDLRHLGDALARIESDVVTIERFRDWLWSGAATGFEVELQNSFMEALDDLVVEGAVDGGTYDPGVTVAAVRTEVMRSLSDQAVMISASMLADAACRDEFDLPLGTASPHADGSLFAMPGTEAAALRARCEDEARWALDETALLLAHRALNEVSRPERVARSVLDLVSRDRHGAATALLDALTGNARRSDPFARDLLRLLDREAFAEAIAAALLPAPSNARRVVEVLLTVGEVTRRRLARRLLEHAAHEPAWVSALAEMMLTSGGRLGPILVDAEEVPTPAHIAVLTRIAGDLALDALFARAREDGARWVGLALGALCRAAIERGRAADLVLPFVRDRGVDVVARVAALDILQAWPELCAEASAWRPAELLEAPEVREKLRAMRDALKAAR